jgi:hypothetical protein
MPCWVGPMSTARLADVSRVRLPVRRRADCSRGQNASLAAAPRGVGELGLVRMPFRGREQTLRAGFATPTLG